jgi:hypothetical protein
LRPAVRPDKFGSLNFAYVMLAIRGLVSVKSVGFPTTVLIDQREKLPYAFDGIVADRRDGGGPLVIQTETLCLPTGDYSLGGYADLVAVERKSLEDLYGTLGGGRERFEHELHRLDAMPFASIVVEATLGVVVTQPPARSRLIPKTVMRSMIAWRYRFPRVHWHFVDDRRLAEILTFRLLERFYVDVVCDGKRPKLSRIDLGTTLSEKGHDEARTSGPSAPTQVP